MRDIAEKNQGEVLVRRNSNADVKVMAATTGTDEATYTRERPGTAMIPGLCVPSSRSVTKRAEWLLARGHHSRPSSFS